MAGSERGELIREAQSFAAGMMDICETLAKNDEYSLAIRTGIANELEARGQDKALAEQLSDPLLLAVRDSIVRREWVSMWIDSAESLQETDIHRPIGPQ